MSDSAERCLSKCREMLSTCEGDERQHPTEVLEKWPGFQDYGNEENLVECIDRIQRSSGARCAAEYLNELCSLLRQTARLQDYRNLVLASHRFAMANRWDDDDVDCLNDQPALSSREEGEICLEVARELKGWGRGRAAFSYVMGCAGLAKTANMCSAGLADPIVSCLGHLSAVGGRCAGWTFENHYGDLLAQLLSFSDNEQDASETICRLKEMTLDLSLDRDVARRFAQKLSIEKVLFLRNVGREGDAVAFIESSSDPLDLRRLVSFREAESGNPSRGLALLERATDIQYDHYEDRARLTAHLARLEERYGATRGDILWYLLSWSGRLVECRRARHAVCLLTVYARIRDRDFRIRESLSSRLKAIEARTGAYTTVMGEFNFGLAESLFYCGRRDDVTDLIECVAEISREDYGYRDRIRRSLSKLTDAIGVMAGGPIRALRFLVESLELGARLSDARVLLDVWMRHNLDDWDWCFFSSTRTVLVKKWLAFWGKHDITSLEICAQLISALDRRLTGGQATTWQDEANANDMYRHILDVYRYWERSADVLVHRRQGHLQTQLLYSNLYQRGLLSRVEQAQFVLDDDPDALPPVESWPFSTQNNVVDVFFAAYGIDGPPYAEPTTDALDNGASVSAFDVVEHEPEKPLERTENRETPGEWFASYVRATLPDDPEWYDEAQAVFRHELTDSTLSEAVGHHGVLLTVGFSPHGELFWMASTTDGTSLAPIAASDAGQKTDRDCLRWQSALHEFHIFLIYLAHSFPGKWHHVRKKVERAATTIANLLQDRRMSAARESLSDLAQQMAGEGFVRQAKASVVMFAPLLCELETNAENLDMVVAACREFGNDLKGVEPDIPFVDTLDELTGRFIKKTSRILRLDALGPHLDPDTTDVVLHVEDVLHAIPFPYLPIGDEHSCRKVRSIRTTLSPKLDLLHRRQERKSYNDEPKRLLALSWLGDGDPARSAAMRLHKAQMDLAESFGVELCQAAESPQGRRGTLYHATEAGRYYAMTICGHGHIEQHGVQLADGLWSGGGQDFKPAELVILLACSQGRLRQNGQRDVEGLGVELAVHRCRSALTCRSIVHTETAVDFTDEILRQYLELRREHDLREKPLRACALNQARRIFLEEAARGQPRLNTAAAFELYGLG